MLELDPDASRELHFHCDSAYVVEGVLTILQLCDDAEEKFRVLLAAFEGRNGTPPSRRASIKNLHLILYIQELINNRKKAVKVRSFADNFPHLTSRM